LTITNSRLENNQALNGGALYPRFSNAQTTIIDSVLYNNRATDTATNGWGGAILAWDGAPVTLQNTDVYSNSAWEGGGIFNHTNSILLVENNTRLRNNRAFEAGGIFNYYGGTLTTTNVIFSQNVATNANGGRSV
jgi:hypothetical protein